MQEKLDQRFITLFDRFTHGGMTRRAFMARLTTLTGSAAAAQAILPLLENNYARAETIAATDPRLVAEDVTFPGTAGYLVRPAVADPVPGAVILIHENRGLNAHIRDVARRLALAGFVVYAPDYLAAQGGTPPDADQARDLIGALKPDAVAATSGAAFTALSSLSSTTGKVGAMGFCWGGGQVNALAVAEPMLAAGVVYYGMQPKTGIDRIKAPLLLHYAGLDDRINAGMAAYGAALAARGKVFEAHVYDGVNHAFNNDTNAARHDARAAALAWGRTVAFLKKYLA